MNYLKQSTAVTLKFGPFMDEDDGKTEETALTITQPDVRLSKNGANIIQKSASGTAAHDELGYYNVALSTTDTDTLGILMVAVHESGALPVFQYFQVVPANVYDSLVLGSDDLDVEVNASSLTNINAEVDTAISDAALATAADIAALNDLSEAQVNAQVDAALDTVIPGSPTAGSINEVLQRLSRWLSIGTVDDSTPAAGEFDGDNALSTITGFYNGQTLLFTNGNLVGQSRIVSGYAAANETFTFDEAFAFAPANGDAFILISTKVLEVSDIATAVWDAAIASHQLGATFGKAFDDSPVLGVTLAADSIIADVIAASGADKLADTLYRMTTATVEGAAGGVPTLRTLYGMLAGMVHLRERDAGDNNIILYQSDDVTVLATIPITTDTSLSPIKKIDPA